ncbi:unnamed protein product [marine sediment metagenome]|uniref:Acylphosphatase-like domain-containing protein n=1 Tax=marine sediment metagenome TaxID=412755 RepID=X1BZS0_9ZZZZ
MLTKVERLARISVRGVVQGVGFRPFIYRLAQDVRNQIPVPVISLKFHNTVAQIIAEMCKLIARESGINQVALSGGVFQNRLLLKLATSALQREGFSVLTHHLVPANDGGISLGQAVIANFNQEEAVK